MMNFNPVQLNTNTYTIAIDNTSRAATLLDSDIQATNWLITNLSDKAVFVTSGVTSPTAVFPTSATVPLGGKVINPGFSVIYGKNPTHKYISAIQLAAGGVGNLYIAPADGE